MHKQIRFTLSKAYETQIVQIRRDPNRSAHIALVAGEKGKRLVLLLSLTSIRLKNSS